MSIGRGCSLLLLWTNSLKGKTSFPHVFTSNISPFMCSPGLLWTNSLTIKKIGHVSHSSSPLFLVSPYFHILTYPYIPKSAQVQSANCPMSPLPSQEVQGPRLHRQAVQHHPHHSDLHRQNIIGVNEIFDIYRQERKNVSL